MLLDFNFNGYKFFNDSNISFNADARISRLMSNSQYLDGKNVLKTIAIYGANNSGKTNIVTLFSLLKDILNGSDSFYLNCPIFSDPEITTISITFNNNKGQWYNYVFAYNNTTRQFEKEELYNIFYYKGGNYLKKAIFIKDTKNKILQTHGDDKSDYLSVIPSRLPFLYSVQLESGVFSSLKEYLDEFRELADSIEIVNMYNIPYDNILQSMKGTNERKIQFIKEFVKNADVSITDFEFDKNAEVKIDMNQINEKVLNDYNLIVDNLKLATTYNGKKVPSLLFDSTGTKKIEAIAAYIYDALTQGKILIVDEIDSGLHFKLTRALISIFNNLINKKSQLIFITHDLMLINSKLLMRKDQIYFVIRDNNHSDLICMRNAPVNNGGPRDVTEIVKKYNRGEFGNIPNPSFIKTITEVLTNGPK